MTKNRYLVDQTKLFKVDEGTPDPIDSGRLQKRLAPKASRRCNRSAGAVASSRIFGYGLITDSLLAEILPPLRKMVPILTADVSGRQSSLLRFKSVDLLCPTVSGKMRETLQDFSSEIRAQLSGDCSPAYRPNKR